VDGRRGGHDGHSDDGRKGCTRKGVNVEKHAGGGVSGACAETVPLNDGGNIVEEGVVCGWSLGSVLRAENLYTIKVDDERDGNLIG
jgi:hypothetical protein